MCSIIEHVETAATKVEEKVESYEKSKLMYTNFLTLGYWHVSALYGLYLCFTSAKLATIIFSSSTLILTNVGVIAGSHRLWSHRAYKAKMPLQILLMVMNSIGFQNTVMNWVRDHRMHHKYSDTNADPHNPSRGLFFSHIGWLFIHKHDEVKNKAKNIDMSDIFGNPVLRFQQKYAIPLIGTLCFVLPTAVPMYCWDETLKTAWHVNLLRYVLCMHMMFLINSLAHAWGNRPFDKSIRPTDHPGVSIATLGEGYHNYHHVFPWDYRATELGTGKLCVATAFIDFFAWIGWAYDLKTVSSDMAKNRARRTGDGTRIRSLSE